MSEGRPSGSMVLNWRGPLLAAGIFAAAFAILLLMAHQNQSNTSDMGSSLREDPYGTSLLFDSYARAGYQVKRSQDQDSLSEQNAGKTTAFFIGGFSYGDWESENGKIRIGAKLRGRLEDFLSRGGRVVLVQYASALKSESQGWEVENKWNETPHESAPVWISPDLRAMPAGSEAIYRAADAPWLKTDDRWTVLYPAPDGADAGRPERVHMAMRQVGKGELIAASQESFLLNEAIKTRPNPVLLDFLAGGRPVVWVDETLHGLHQDEGVLWLVGRYRLGAALMLFWLGLLALLWSLGGNLVRRPRRDATEQIVRQGEGAGAAARHLLQRSVPAKAIVAECWEQYRRRSPQDAQAISGDARWASRLSAALAEPPLSGYQELSRIIAEHHASGKGPAQAVSSDGSRDRTNKIPEEA